MKKVTALFIALGTLASANQCWGLFSAISINNFDSNNPIFYLEEGSPLPADGNSFIQLLGGPDEGNLAPVAIADGTSTFNLIPGVDGFFDGGFGEVPGVDPDADATFQLRAWRNAASFDEASERGASAVFTNPTGSAPRPNEVGFPEPAGLANAPSFVVVPEPTTYLLGLLGGAALFLFRRRK